MQYELIKDPKQVDKRKWEEILAKTNRDDVFLSYGFAQTCLDYYNEVYFIAIVKDSNIVGLAIGEIASETTFLSHFTRRTIFYCKPFYTNNDVLQVILSDISSSHFGLFAQIRPQSPLEKLEKEMFSKMGFIFEDHLNAIIPLSNKDIVWGHFKKDKRKNIRKAENIGLIVDSSFSESNFNRFYELLYNLYRNKNHSIKHKDFFRFFINNSEGNIKLANVIFEDKIIATQLYSISTTTITAHYTATDPIYKNLKAGDLLIWFLIKEGLNRKCKYFDFGGAGKPNRNYGPREYKARFGTIFNNSGRLIFTRSLFYKLIMKCYYLLYLRK